MSNSKSNFFSECTRSNKFPFSLALALEILSNLQIIYLILKTILNKNKDFLFPLLASIRNVILFSKEKDAYGLLDDNHEVMLAIWIISTCYLILHLGLMAYVILCQSLPSLPKPQRGLSLSQIISTALLIHSRLIFFPLHYFLLGVTSKSMSCTIENNTFFACGEKWFSLTLILTLINIGLAGMKEWFLYQVGTNTKDAYAVKNNLHHKIGFLHKMTGISFYILIKNQDRCIQMTLALNLLLLLTSLLILFIKLPFHSIPILKISIIANGISIALSLFSIFNLIGLNHHLLDFAWILLTSLLIKALLVTFNKKSQRILNGIFRSPEELLFYMSLVKMNDFGYILAPVAKLTRDSLVLNGRIVHDNPEMGIYSGMRTPKDRKEYKIKTYTYIMENMSSLLERHPDSQLLLLNMAYISFKKLKNMPRALKYIKQIESQKLSISMQNSLDNLNHSFRQMHTETYSANTGSGIKNNQIKLLEYITSRDIALLIKEDIHTEVAKHVKFWEEIKKDKADAKKALETACEIDLLSKRIEKQWQDQSKALNHSFINCLLLYSTYLDLIKEMPGPAKKLLTRFWSASHHTNRDQFYDSYSSEAAAVIILTDKASIGIIADASGSAQPFFQAKREKIIGKNLLNLLPEMASQVVLSLFEAYLQDPSGKLNSGLKTYMKTQEGEFFEVEIEVKLYPQLDKDVKLIVFFKKLSLSQSIIITATNGAIVDFSRSLEESLLLKDPAVMKSHQVKFQDICPEFNQINLAFNIIYNVNRKNEGDSPPNSRNSTVISTYSRRSQHKHHTQATILEQITPHRSDQRETTRNKSRKKRSLAQSNQANSSIISNPLRELCTEYIHGGTLRISPLTEKSTMRHSSLYEVQVTPYKSNGHLYKIIAVSDFNKKEVPSRGFSKDLVPSQSSSVSSDFAGDFPESDERRTTGYRRVKKQSESFQKGEESGRTSIFGAGDHTVVPLKIFSESFKDFSFDLAGKDTETINLSKLQAKSREKANSISGRSEYTRSFKVLHNVLDKPQTYRLARITKIIVVTLMALIAGLVVWNLIASKAAIHEITTGIGIINIGNLRLTQATLGWQNCLRFLLRYLKLSSGTSSFTSITNAQIVVASEIIKQNNLMEETLASMDKNNDFSDVSIKDINIWNKDENKTLSQGTMNVYISSILLANKFRYMGEIATGYNDTRVLNEIPFMVNNTGNDYLIASERLISLTQQKLKDTIDNKLQGLNLILAFKAASVVLICLCLVVAGGMIAHSYKILFKTLLKIDDKLINERLGQIKRLQGILKEDIESNKLGRSVFNALKPERIDKGADSARRGKKVVMKGINIHLAKYIYPSLLVIQSITVLFAVAMQESIMNFKSLQVMNTQLSTTATSQYQTNLLVGLVYVDVIYHNDTSMMIKNQRPEKELLNCLDLIRGIDDSLISVFNINEGETADPIIKQIFSTTPCSFLASTLQASCRTATSYQNLGVIALNAALYTVVRRYVKMFISKPTFDNAKAIINPYVAILRPIADTLGAAYQFINAHIVATFEVKSSLFLVKTNLLHILMVMTIIFSAVFVNFMTIERFKALDMSRAKVLRAVSNKILTENKALGFYLTKQFGKAREINLN